MKRCWLQQLILACFVFRSISVFGQKNDTTYFNSKWQICEEPIAAYYRIGNIHIDSFVFYTGIVKDYYLNDVLQMEGEYSMNGEKDGRFSFYYPNGNLQASGDFKQDHQYGAWDYYYETGIKKSTVNFPGNDTEFIVLDFYDKSGKVLTKDGTGSFEIPGTDGVYPFLITGEFRNKKRYGTWSYYITSYWKERALKIREKYDENGFKKGQVFDMSGSSVFSYKDKYRPVLIEYIDKFSNTEIFSKDPLSFMRGSSGTLIDFLIDKSKPEVNVNGKSFDESILKILNRLNQREVIALFKEREKKYKGKIVFYIDNSGIMTKIEVSGNISEQEKKELLYVLQKFKNIQELSFENIGIEAYNSIYFYTIDFREFLQRDNLTVSPATLLLFTMIPYEQVEMKLREAFKKLK